MDVSSPPTARRPLPTPQRVSVPLAPMDGAHSNRYSSAYSQTQTHSRHPSYIPQSMYQPPYPESNTFSSYDDMRDDDVEQMDIESHMGMEPTMGGGGGGYGRSGGERLDGIDEGGMGMSGGQTGMRDLTGANAPFGGMRLEDIQREPLSPDSFTYGKKKKGFVGGFFKGLKRFPSKLIKRKKKQSPPAGGRMTVNLDGPDPDMNVGMGPGMDMDGGRTIYEPQTPMLRAPGPGGFVPPPLRGQDEMEAPLRPVGPPVTVVDYDSLAPPGAAITVRRSGTSHHSHHSGASHHSHHSDGRGGDGTSETHHEGGLTRSRTRTTRASPPLSVGTARPLRGTGSGSEAFDHRHKRLTHDSHSASGTASGSASASLSPSTDVSSFPHTRLGNMRRAVQTIRKLPWVASTRITSDYKPDISSSRSRSRPELEAKRRQQGLPRQGESWYKPSPEQIARRREREEARRRERRRRRREMGLSSKGSATTDSHSHTRTPPMSPPALPYGFLPPPGLTPMVMPGPSPPTPLQNMLTPPQYAYTYGGQPMYLLPQPGAMPGQPPPVPGLAPPPAAANAPSRMNRSMSSNTRTKNRPLSAFIPGFGRNFPAAPAPPQLTAPQGMQAMYMMPASPFAGMGQMQPGFVPQQAQQAPAPGAGLKRGPSSGQGGSGGAGGAGHQSWVANGPPMN